MRVQCKVFSPDGSERAVLTYEAGPDTKVGDTGKVSLWLPDEGESRLFPAKVVSLDSDYTGRCKAFIPSRSRL